MASLDELIDHAQGNLSQIDEVAGSIDATKAMADELSSLFAALTVHGLAEGSQRLKAMAEQAQQQLAAAKLTLEELITAAEGLKTLTSGSGPSGPSATVAMVGAPLTAPGEAPKDYRAELAGSDDDDKSRNRFARGARAAIR
ncbi:hypothetical protein LX16_5342 [Stackebrandtia albiflava]|uniref:Excreted virulence factor EspC (Type VII ESX diderm) n=1 Tax=Stackebrandtia albiflava TaxID=406432 RepID=A0A562UL85_9ACTN|nr:hypothetical protein [Stackebrandtia albiflava]TWJ06378.1 hypothetical protein LX16_5342 [Stackebrandtia albiflava]